MDQTSATGRQVVDHLGIDQGQCIEVDDVQIGLVPRRDHASIVEAVQPSGILGHLMHRELEREGGSLGAVATHVGEHIGGHARVTERAAMRAAVREPEYGMRVHNPLTLFLKIARIVTHQIQQRATGSHHIHQGLAHMDAACFGDPGNRVLNAGLVAETGRQHEHLVPGRDHAVGPGIARYLGLVCHDLGPECRIE